MNALVEQTSFGVTTSSRTVAEVFTKEHHHVLRAIDELLAKRPDQCARNFARTSADVPMPKGGGVRQIRAYEMTRDGFTLLAFGFTGDEALDWKLAYIDAFNRMEEEIARRAEPDDGEPDGSTGVVVMLPLSEIARGMAVVSEYRRMFGLAAARWMIGQLGLPVPPEELGGGLPMLRGGAAISLAITPATVTDWVEACCERDRDAKSASGELYRNYLDWCANEHRTAETQRSFGDGLARMGFSKYKSGSGNIWRRGIRLLD